MQLPDTLERLNSNKLIMMMTPSLCTQSNENLLPLDGDEIYSSLNSWNRTLFSYQPSGTPREHSSHFWLLTIQTASSQSLEVTRASWCFPWHMNEERAKALFHPRLGDSIFGEMCPNHTISEGKICDLHNSIRLIQSFICSRWQPAHLIQVINNWQCSVLSSQEFVCGGFPVFWI